MAKVKQVRDVKGEEPKPPTTMIDLGNVSILTVKLLDQLVQEVKGLREDLKKNG